MKREACTLAVEISAVEIWFGGIECIMGVKGKTFISEQDPLWITLASIAEAEGISLYDLERVSANGLRIFVQSSGSERSGSAGQNSGVTSEDCSRLCRRLIVYFLAEGSAFGLGSNPELDVSSPGINRHLRLPWHFSEARGMRVKVKGDAIVKETAEGTVEGTKVGLVSIGNLSDVSSGEITVEDELTHRICRFCLNDVRDAHLDFKF